MPGPTFIGTSSTQTTGVTSYTITVTPVLQAGDAIVLFAGHADATFDATAITDSKGNQYTRAVGTSLAAFGRIECFVALNCKASAASGTVITVNYGANSATGADGFLGVYRFLAPADGIDASGAGGSSAGTAPSVTLVTTQPNEVVVCGCYVSSAVTAGGVNAGFTSRLITGDSNGLCDDIVTARGSYAGGYTNTNANWVAAAVSVNISRLPRSRALLAVF